MTEIRRLAEKHARDAANAPANQNGFEGLILAEVAKTYALLDLADAIRSRGLPPRQ